MSTPTHDEPCRPLLTDEEYHRIHMLKPEEFEQLPDEVKEHYGHTHEWHFKRRMGDIVLESIQTSDGMTYQEVLEQRRRAKTQTDK